MVGSRSRIGVAVWIFIWEKWFRYEGYYLQWFTVLAVTSFFSSANIPLALIARLSALSWMPKVSISLSSVKEPWNWKNLVSLASIRHYSLAFNRFSDIPISLSHFSILSWSFVKFSYPTARKDSSVEHLYWAALAEAILFKNVVGLDSSVKYLNHNSRLFGCASFFFLVKIFPLRSDLKVYHNLSIGLFLGPSDLVIAFYYFLGCSNILINLMTIKRIQKRIQNVMRIMCPMRLVLWINPWFQLYKGGVDVLSRR